MIHSGAYTNPKASLLLPTPYSTKVLWSTQMKSAVMRSAILPDFFLLKYYDKQYFSETKIFRSLGT